MSEKKTQRVEELETQLAQAERDGERFCQRIAELERRDPRILRCAFCHKEYPPGTPATQNEALTAHILNCAKHPLRARITALEATVELRQVISEELWKLLDDIDTASDMFKPANEAGYKRFYEYAMRKVVPRHDWLLSDGYLLSVPETFPDRPIADGTSRMSFNASPVAAEAKDEKK